MEWNQGITLSGKKFWLARCDEDFRIEEFVHYKAISNRETKYPLDIDVDLPEGNYILSGGARANRVDKKFRVDIFGLVEVEG